MLTLIFDGWFQCRLPTNPDPADEPRGVSGYSFALANEPDLDRIIRFHEPVHPRSYGPKVGVFVRTAFLDGQALPSPHPLLGARVELLDNPRFEAANGVFAKEPWEPILPFRLQVSLAQEGSILRASLPEMEKQKLQGSVKPRKKQVTTAAVSQLFAAQAGVTNPVQYRARRLELLQAEREKAMDPLDQCALDKRIRELQIPPRSEAQKLVDSERRLLFLNVVEIRSLKLKGQQGTSSAVPVDRQPDYGEDWNAELWMGVWDADALCAFARGVLHIPLVKSGGRGHGASEPHANAPVPSGGHGLDPGCHS